MIIPGTSAPALKVQTVRHGMFDLAADKSEHFSLVVFYRGLHCPICLKYLRELGALLPEFAKRGVEVVVLSTDDAERAAEMDRKIGVADLRHGFGLTLANAREWGLYLSQGIGKTSIGVEEPALFAEPGVFLVRADQTLYYASVQTMPFARPSFADLLASVDFVLAKNYPARGGYVGEVG
jgi:peroxiredoxin